MLLEVFALMGILHIHETQEVLEGYVFQDVETFDTTVANTLDITAEWGQAKTQDEIHSANFVLHKTY